MANVVTQIITALTPEDVVARAVFYFSTKRWRPTSQSQRAATFEGKPPIPLLNRIDNLVVSATVMPGGTEVVVQHPKNVAGLVARFLDALPLTAQTSTTNLGTRDARPNADPSAAALTTPQFSPVLAVKASTRPLSRLIMVLAVAVIVVAVAGYWWLNRHPGRYTADNSNLYPITVNGKSGFMDRSGKTVITPQFDEVWDFSEGLAQVRVGTKFGYINTKGLVAITPQFGFSDRFQYGRARVTLGNRVGFIDKDGKYIAIPDFIWAGHFSGDLAPIRTANGAFAFMNRSGKIVISGPFQMLSEDGFTEGLAPALSSGKWGFIDATGKWVIEPQFDGANNFGDGLAAVAIGRQGGYIDKNGKFVINPQYDLAGNFYEGLATVVTGGKVGFIDTTGRMVIAAKFMAAGIFSDGLAAVQTEDGWWGYIDRMGKLVVDPEFDGVAPFQNGLARVGAIGKNGYLTTAGQFVVDPFPGTNVRAERARIASESVSHRR